MSTQFSSLYLLARDKFSTVQQIKFKWNVALENEEILWLRRLNVQEKQEIQRLNVLIESIKLEPGKDTLIWGQMEGKFSTASCYRSLLSEVSLSGPWQQIWKQKIPTKIKIFLWQLAHGCLPSLSFLAKRNIVTVSKCKWCDLFEEDIEHIFWRCSLARMAWHSFSQWLNIDVSLSQFNLQETFKLTSHKNLRVGGGVCLSALLWTIWMARNNLIFRGHRMSCNDIDLIIKQRSFEWCIASNLILPDQFTTWFISPSHALVNNARRAMINLISYWLQVNKVVGFIDGAWKKDNSGLVKAGIGGFLLKEKATLIFTFSGPTNQESAYDTELEALCFLLKQIAISNYKDTFMTIFSDSKSLINNVHSFKRDIVHSESASLILSVIHNINFIHVDRSLNQEADRLAKEGVTRRAIISGWC